MCLWSYNSLCRHFHQNLFPNTRCRRALEYTGWMIWWNVFSRHFKLKTSRRIWGEGRRCILGILWFLLSISPISLFPPFLPFPYSPLSIFLTIGPSAPVSIILFVYTVRLPGFTRLTYDFKDVNPAGQIYLYVDKWMNSSPPPPPPTKISSSISSSSSPSLIPLLGGGFFFFFF